MTCHSNVEHWTNLLVDIGVGTKVLHRVLNIWELVVNENIHIDIEIGQKYYTEFSIYKS